MERQNLRIDELHLESLYRRSLRTMQLQFRQDDLYYNRPARNPTSLFHYISTISLDIIIWLPMANIKRRRCIRWRLGWLPRGRSKPSPFHSN